MDSSDAREPPAGGYRALVENFPNGVLILFDSDLRYRIVGPEDLPVTGRSASDLVGKPVDELFPKADITDLESILESTLEGRPCSVDTTYRGEIHHIETRPVEIDGDPHGVLVSQDVTEQRRMAEDLRRKNDHLDRFADMVSHDLRNPLNVAEGKLSLYRETGDESLLDDVEAALARIDDLTRDLLALARTNDAAGDSGRVQVREVAQLAWNAIDPHGATLQAESTTVACDEHQLRVLLENLFRNAIEHGSTGDGGSPDDAADRGAGVTVRVGPVGDGFYVEDTGEGISADDRERVFEHGFSTDAGGTGVGLTIVDRIADAHGWEIGLGESDEGGARFEFRPSER